MGLPSYVERYSMFSKKKLRHAHLFDLQYRIFLLLNCYYINEIYMYNRYGYEKYLLAKIYKERFENSQIGLWLLSCFIPYYVPVPIYNVNYYISDVRNIFKYFFQKLNKLRYLNVLLYPRFSILSFNTLLKPLYLIPVIKPAGLENVTWMIPLSTTTFKHQKLNIKSYTYNNFWYRKNSNKSKE